MFLIIFLPIRNWRQWLKIDKGIVIEQKIISIFENYQKMKDDLQELMQKWEAIHLEIEGFSVD